MTDSTKITRLVLSQKIDLYARPTRKSRHEQNERGSEGKDSAVLSFLQTFNTVCNLGSCYEEGDYDPDIEYALRTNHAGRRIVEGSGDDRPLPLSVWPIYCLEQKDPSKNRIRILRVFILLLLRNGPALAGRVSRARFGRQR